MLADALSYKVKAVVAYADWIVGSPMAAITLSFKLAEIMETSHGFAEKDGERMKFKRFVIPRHSTVLRCEELITTSKTTEQVAEAIERDNPHRVTILGQVATAIWRPEMNDKRRWEPIYLARWIVRNWDAADCALCKQGSSALKPKEHWREFAR
ncbi:MAG: hypothetical protein HY220_03275 [Candidatus Sungbacteria bacterium]|uniref:Uncharacterized protein n=1 Tax=Candidatus Sungiibacteriota bacterium TaxID=2750080 RepID=A0A9D6LNS1_9BACT|nr:hypothetical protein [Candidatus Sungbacteria bacterium]